MFALWKIQKAFRTALLRQSAAQSGSRRKVCAVECGSGESVKAGFHREGYSNAGPRSYPQAASFFRHKKVLANVDNLGIGKVGERLITFRNVSKAGSVAGMNRSKIRGGMKRDDSLIPLHAIEGANVRASSCLPLSN